jgi:radical SAM protein with 4Fe4S-binding SPASM domain
MYTIFHDRFRQGLHQKRVSKNLPLKGALELTYRCNLRCVHCYAENVPDVNEINSHQIYRILNELKLAGCLWLLITGGEPLFRDDFLKIYSHIKKQGFLISLFTNATLIDPEIIKYLSKYKPLMVEVTLYALDEKHYKLITAVEGAYKRCIRGIDMLAKYNVPFRIKMPVMNFNKSELEKIRKYADELKVEFRYDPIIHPSLGGSKFPYQFRLSPKEVVEIDKRYQHIKISGCDVKENKWLRKKGFLYNTCGAGLNFFSINPYGKLKLCMLSNYPHWDVLKQGFTAGWKRYFQKNNVFKIGRFKKQACFNCKMLTICDICPGWWKDESGKDIFAPVPYLCRIAKLRWEKLNRG